MGISVEQAKAIAKEVDPKADQMTEFELGYLFMRSEYALSISDPGFAVSKADGKVLYGFGARMFLYQLEVENPE